MTMVIPALLSAAWLTEPSAEDMDFAATRFSENGHAALVQLEARAFAYIPEALRGERFSPVDVDCRWIEIHEGVDAARRSPDRTAYDAAHAAAQRLAAQAREQAQHPTAAGADPAERLAAAAHADRVWTNLWYQTPRSDAQSALIYEHMEALAARPRCEARQAAIAALDDLLAQAGWPAAPEARLAANIAQTVQHAGRRTDLREAALSWASQGLERGEPATARRYALIADRLSLMETGAQRYGTQGRCEDGVWIAGPMNDAAQADRWRAENGLPDLAAHADAMAAACR